MPDCPSHDDLKGYLMGMLSQGLYDDIDAHLDTCELCRTTVLDVDVESDDLLQAMRGIQPEATVVTDSGWRQAEALVKAIGQEWSQAGDATRTTTAPTIRQLREYELLEELGHGGMGTVYKALHTKLKRIVALKVLPNDRMVNAEAVRRFEREMEAVGQLDHDHIVRATDAGEADGTHFLVMEYVEGQDLTRLVAERGPLPVREACEIIRQAALGLQHAQESGMVHRDIKPSNLMLTNAGTVKILDLGLALLNDNPAAGGELTMSNQIMGTLDYMAPEQATDTHSVDIRADLYSLGATLYKLLSSTAPLADIGAHTQVAKLNAVLNTSPARIQRADVPEALVELIGSLLEKDPNARPATPAELVVALQPFAAGADLSRLMDQSPDHTVETEAKPIATATSVNVSSHLIETDANVEWPESGPPPTLVDEPSHPPSRRKLGLGISGLLAAILFGGIWLVIRDKDGNERARILVGDEESVTFENVEEEPSLVDPVEIEDDGGFGHERDVAEWVLGLGGSVLLVGEESQITNSDNLPRTDFRLQSVGFRETAVTADHLMQLTSLPNLKGISLQYTDISDSELAHLARLLRLESITLTKTKITNDGLAHLSGLSNLRQLRLDQNSAIDDGALAHLTGLSDLQFLVLNGTSVTDSGLETIEQLTGLTDLYLQATNVTAAGVARLHEALPNCRIESDFGTLTPIDYDNERQIAEWVLTTGGTLDVLVNDQTSEVTEVTQLPADAFTVVAIRFEDIEAFPGAELGRMNGMPQLESLVLRGLEISDDELESLDQLPELEALELTGSSITNYALANMQRFPGLQRLVLEHTRIDDEGLQHLSEVEQLEWISLQVTDITGDGLRHLRSLPKLQHLGFGSPSRRDSFGDSVIAHLEQFELLSLIVYGSAITNSGFEQLVTSHPTLHSIAFTYSEIDDDAVRHLANLQELYGLVNLGNNRLTDACLEQLQRVSSHTFNLRGTDITPDGVAAFHAARPDATITWDGGWSDPFDYVQERDLAAQLLQNNVTLGITLEGTAEDQVFSPGDLLPDDPFQITMADIGQVAFLDEVLPILAQATEVKELRAVATGITAEQLSVLAPLEKVTHLNLSRSQPITNELLQVAAEQFSGLDELRLDNTVLPETGLSAISEFNSLQYLSLVSTENTDAAIEAAQNLPDLAGLWMRSSTASWPVLRRFLKQDRRTGVYFDASVFVFHYGGSFSSKVDGEEQLFTSESPTSNVYWMEVTGLDFSGTEVSTDDFSFLPLFETSLLSPAGAGRISLSGTNVTDGVLKYFRTLPELEQLDLSNTALSNHGVLQLTALPAINSVDLRGTMATAMAIAHLRQTRPDCEFLSDFTEQELVNAPSLFAFDHAIPTESPFDQLQRDDIDPYELRIAGDGDPVDAPPELVAIIGDSRLRHWHLGSRGPQIDFLPDGQTLVASGADGRLTFWDLETGRANKIVRTDLESLTTICVPQSNEVILSPYGSGPIAYDLVTGELKWSEPTGPHLRSTTSDGRLAIGVSGNWFSQHFVWNLPQRRVVHSSTTYENGIGGVAIHSDGRLAATGHVNEVYVWDVRSGEKRLTFDGHSEPVIAIVFSPNGELIASAGNGRELIVWEAANGNQRFSAQTWSNNRSLAFSPDASMLAVGEQHWPLSIWDVATGDRIHSFPHLYESWTTVCFSPDGGTFAAASHDGTIRIWNTETWQEHQQREHFAKVAGTALSEDGRYLATAHWDTTATVRESATGRILHDWEQQDGATAIAVHSSNDLAVVASHFNYHLRAYALSSGELIAQTGSLGNRISRVRFTPDGQSLVATTASGHVFILDPFTLAIRHQHLTNGTGYPFDISLDGRYLATFIHVERFFRLIDIDTGEIVYESPEFESTIQAVAFNPDGKSLTVALNQPENALRIWDLETNTQIAAFGTRGGPGDYSDAFHGGPTIAYHPDGKTLYADFGEGQIQIWDLEELGTDDAMTPLRVAGPMDGFYGLHVDPAGKHLITHNGNDTIYVLRLDEGAAARDQ